MASYSETKQDVSSTSSLILLPLHEKDVFCTKWKKIKNSGQHNNGIYVNPDDSFKIVKCVTSDIGTMNNQSQDANAKVGFDIFPKIYKYFTFSHEKDGDKFIEMNKLDCDVTDLLMDLLPKQIVSGFVDSSVLTKRDGDDLLRLLAQKMPSTFCSDKYGLNFRTVTPIIQCILMNRLNGINAPKTDLELEQLFVESKIEDYSRNYLTSKGVEQVVNVFDDFVAEFEESTLIYDVYDEFMREYQKELRKLIDVVNDQILLLNLHLLKADYFYGDHKYDNYGVRLSLSREYYLGVDWNDTNKIGDYYFYISILDWESGLRSIDSTHESLSSYGRSENDDEVARWISFYFTGFDAFFSVHGQYNIKRLNEDTVNESQMHLFVSYGVPADIISVLMKYVAHVQSPPNEHDAKTITSLKTAKTYLNRKYDDGFFKMNVKRLIESPLMIVDDEKLTRHEVLLIASGANNFTHIKFDPADETYTLTCMDDNRKPVPTVSGDKFSGLVHWPMGQIISKDLKKIIRLASTIYS